MNYREKIRKAIECPQFNNTRYGVWGALTFEQRKYIRKLLDELDSADDYFKKIYLENQELKKQLHEASLTIQEMIEQDIECPSNCEKLDKLLKENQELKKQLEEIEFIVGLRQKRNLISKFDKEYDEEDKKKNPNRDYAGIMPDAEEVYRRYYTMKTQQKEFINYLEEEIKTLEKDILETIDNVDKYMKEVKSLIIEEILQKYKSIIGVSDENNKQ